MYDTLMSVAGLRNYLYWKIHTMFYSVKFPWK